MFHLHSLADQSHVMEFESVRHFVIGSTLSSVSGVLFDFGHWWCFLTGFILLIFHFCFPVGSFLVSFLGESLLKWLMTSSTLVCAWADGLVYLGPFMVLDSFRVELRTFLAFQASHHLRSPYGEGVGLLGQGRVACSCGLVFILLCLCDIGILVFSSCCRQEKMCGIMCRVRKATRALVGGNFCLRVKSVSI